MTRDEMQKIGEVVRTVWQYYEQNGRHDMPWRQPDLMGVYDPYHILVSEIMLQQTQVSRVWPKYQAFLRAFPSTEHLSQASLESVLIHWSGLGYNRRAKFLWQAATMIQSTYAGRFPREYADLIALPGVGPNTAGAILAYAYDYPALFIETNIRTVLIHHLFTNDASVNDRDLRPFLQAMLDIATQDGQSGHSPRSWYWALMDYGNYLKKTVGNSACRSQSYSTQSAFAGSKRQIRGYVLRQLTVEPVSYQELERHITDSRLPAVLDDLMQEGLISRHKELYRLG